MLALLLPLADFSTAAVLTLVLPLGLTLIALGVWYYLATRTEAPPHGETAPREPDQPATPAPE